jgi:hypothetical protein
MTVPLFAVIFLVLIGMVVGAVLIAFWYSAFITKLEHAEALIHGVRRTMVEHMPACDRVFRKCQDGCGATVCPCCGFSEDADHMRAGSAAS